MSPRKLFIALALGAVVLGGAFLALPRSNCDDELDPQIARLTDRAHEGELEAIAALYALNRQRGVAPLEEYWALRGAMTGDSWFQNEYVALFKSRFTDNERGRVIKSIEAQQEFPRRSKLLEMLKTAQRENQR